MNETAIYFVSVATENGQVGAVLVEVDAAPSLQATRIDPDGRDIELMGIGKWHTKDELIEKGYGSSGEDEDG